MLHKGTDNKQEQPYSGPHVIQKVNTNGTVHLQMGAVIDTVNILQLTPYKNKQHQAWGKVQHAPKKETKKKPIVNLMTY